MPFLCVVAIVVGCCDGREWSDDGHDSAAVAGAAAAVAVRRTATTPTQRNYSPGNSRVL